MMDQTSYPDGVTFREAQEHEDGLLSRILCNSFLPLWNHNWFHNVPKMLEPVIVHDPAKPNSPSMSSTQSCRVAFYLSLIKLTRSMGGSVLVTQIAHPESPNDRAMDVGSILLWLPPGKNMDNIPISTLWSSGFLGLTVPWKYGPRAFYRIDNIFEANITKMLNETLGPRGVERKECGFVNMIASNQAYAGKGYASMLLKWQIDQHLKDHPKAPVLLDTTTEQGIRAYTKLGFEMLAEKAVDTGTDAHGIPLKKDAGEATRELGKKTCVQRVMLFQSSK